MAGDEVDHGLDHDPADHERDNEARAMIQAKSVSIEAPDWTRSHPEAATMVGMARKNENSAAARLSRPRTRAPEIVAPERETQG